jgi:UDP-galactopyranose mutase
MHFDWLVVGAGLTGATFAERLAAVQDQRVLVIDRRPHIAGNAHDYHDAEGLLVHGYGAHIFHTNSRKVWTYLSRFTQWRRYEHRVLGSVDGQLVPIPFNLTTLAALMPGLDGDRIKSLLLEKVGLDQTISVLKLLEHEDPRLRKVGELAYEKIFLGYSAKQWGMRPENLDRSVTGRVPIVVSRDDRYFHDTFQGIPANGYTAMVQRMLDHDNIVVELGVNYGTEAKHHTIDRVLYTGPLDELLDYEFEPLPYRSLRFETSHYNRELVQPVAVVNFPNDHEYTRTLEHKHLTGQHHPMTAVTTEWPQAHAPGKNEPYYPIPEPASRHCYSIYRDIIDKKYPRFLIAGRLADYRYYNMDQAVNRALVLFKERLMA